MPEYRVIEIGWKEISRLPQRHFSRQTLRPGLEGIVFPPSETAPKAQNCAAYARSQGHRQSTCRGRSSIKRFEQNALVSFPEAPFGKHLEPKYFAIVCHKVAIAGTTKGPFSGIISPAILRAPRSSAPTQRSHCWSDSAAPGSQDRTAAARGATQAFPELARQPRYLGFSTQHSSTTAYNLWLIVLSRAPLARSQTGVVLASLLTTVRRRTESLDRLCPARPLPQPTRPRIPPLSVRDFGAVRTIAGGASRREDQGTRPQTVLGMQRGGLSLVL